MASFYWGQSTERIMSALRDSSQCEVTWDPKDFGLTSSWKFPQSPFAGLLSSLHPSIPPPFFFLIQISHSMPCTCFGVIWTSNSFQSELIFFSFFFSPSICFSLWGNTAALPSTPDQKVERWGFWYANEALLSELTFVRKPNRGEVTWKGAPPPPPPFCPF